MGDVTDDYGRRVGMALKAVRQLHADAVRLLTECDGTIGKGRRVCTKGYAATEGLSNLPGGKWMADGAYRCYAASPATHPGRVEAVCLCFLGDVVAADEPVLITGLIDYRLDAGQELQDLCEGWDVWYLLADNCPERVYGKVLSGGPLTWQDDGKSFDGFRLIAVPLFSVTSMVGVVALMEQVRAAAIPAADPTVAGGEADQGRGVQAP